MILLMHILKKYSHVIIAMLKNIVMKIRSFELSSFLFCLFIFIVV